VVFPPRLALAWGALVPESGSAESLFGIPLGLLWRNLAQDRANTSCAWRPTTISSALRGLLRGRQQRALLAILNDDINQLERFFSEPRAPTNCCSLFYHCARPSLPAAQMCTQTRKDSHLTVSRTIPLEHHRDTR